jgi:endonuclease/exonuclease/phosphatase family metal-dependent hydrolase
MNQALLRGKTIRNNLIDVATFLEALETDVVALQEADAPSRWSGNFDHVELLAEHTAMPCMVHGTHASNRWYNFGTALISVQPFAETLIHDFVPSRPTTTKGFVMGTVLWNPRGSLSAPLKLNLVSVHLDFSRQSVRTAQVSEMIDILGDRDGSLVVMGDFNTNWVAEDSSLKYLAQALGLHAWKAEDDSISTYHSKDTRLDWILLSQDLKFIGHEVMQQVVSDHRAVWAEIGLLYQEGKQTND